MTVPSWECAIAGIVGHGHVMPRRDDQVEPDLVTCFGEEERGRG
jgi:hypothetical protein